MNTWDFLKEHVPWIGVVLGAVAGMAGTFATARVTQSLALKQMAKDLSRMESDVRSLQARMNEGFKEVRAESSREQNDLRAKLESQRKEDVDIATTLVRLEGQMNTNFSSLKAELIALSSGLAEVKEALKQKADKE